MSIKIMPGTTEANKPLLLYNNVFTEGTVTVSSETADGAAANAFEDTTFDFWTPAVASATITVDMGTAVYCDALGIASHSAGSDGASLAVSYSTNGSDYTTVLSVDPTNDSTIIGLFPLTLARYWRVSTADAVASYGIIRLGRRVIIPDGVISGHVGLSHAKRVELLVNKSIGGQKVGTTVRRVGAETSIDFGLMDKEFVETDLAEFETFFNDGLSFFYAGSPTETPDDYGLCWRSVGELRPAYDTANLMQVSMDVMAYVE